MKSIIFSIIAILLFTSCKSQKEAVDVAVPEDESTTSTAVAISTDNTMNRTSVDGFLGEWVLLNHIKDSVLLFQKAENIDQERKNVKKFTFKTDSLEYSVHKPLPMCGNGMLFLNKTDWELNDSRVTLTFGGGYRIESYFDYKYEYTIDRVTDQEIQLTKVKVLFENEESIPDRQNKQ